MHDTTVPSGPFPDDELRRALRRLVRFGELPEPHDHAGFQVSLSEVMALGELSESGVLSQQALAGRLGLEKSTISRLAAGLEKRGWLARERDPGNRRFYRLKLTEKGRGVADLIGNDLRHRHARLLGALTPEEMAGLQLGLSGLTRVLDEHAHENSHGPYENHEAHAARAGEPGHSDSSTA